MRLIYFLLRASDWSIAAIATGAGLVSGACSAGLIATINSTIHAEEKVTLYLVGSFIGLGVAKFVTNAISRIMLAQYSRKTIARLRLSLCTSILGVPLRHLEEIGSSRLMASLTSDVGAISDALRGLPRLAVNATILIGCAGYLAWYSTSTFLIVCGFLALGGLGHWLLARKAFRLLKTSREYHDKLFRHFRSLTDGIKELKLHYHRRAAFIEENIEATNEAIEEHHVTATSHFVYAYAWFELMLYTIIGLIIFALSGAISGETITSFVLVIIYAIGPLSMVMYEIPVFSRANVAIEKVERLRLSLTAVKAEKENAQVSLPATWEQLKLSGVTHTYYREKEDSNFVIGPLDVSFHAGELVFLVGGNGSGKTTLAKIITGLYPPESGSVHLDGKQITDENRDAYRQLFSVVFSDFYLFDSFLGLDTENIDGPAQRYLVQLQLDHKLKIENGVLSTIDLSQGQRKRLALLTAYLEDRPFYLFDEWAADQDPLFKDVFYRQLLPELKAKGKTIVVISHDDHYYDVADRIVKLDYGQLVQEVDTYH